MNNNSKSEADILRKKAEEAMKKKPVKTESALPDIDILKLN
jgi:hypothetical protein